MDVILTAMCCRTSGNTHDDSTHSRAVEADIEEEVEGNFFLDNESLAQLREKYCIQCLEILGEYVEVLGPVLHEKGVDVCLALLAKSSKNTEIPKGMLLLPDVLKLICALAAHRKFAALFVDRGGMQKLLAVPRVAETFFGLSSCLFTIGSLQGIMERVCALPTDVIHQRFLMLFGAQEGLEKVLILLHGAASVRFGVVVGEIANFAAYAFAPAILVTPLGALSIIIRHLIKVQRWSTTIVLHAPQEQMIESVAEVWDLATEAGFLLYAALVIVAVFILIVRVIPHYGQTHIMVYVGVMSVKALGIALKLTFSGTNQLIFPQTWALDTFNTAVVSPIYYVMFTMLTILASVIMFKDWDRQNATQIVTEMCGFLTILSGTFLLHKTNNMADGMPGRIPKHIDEEDDFTSEGIPLRCQESLRS
ncbi:hypothetical protein IFM89_030386 [Coptis chinensis]|uniref:Magnesium transporter n=1 Tax=Coptis chinensis TaxID=261450 RepID=A0A835H0E8_9MAGN|nr:hypothetical protein IFM89_030386 [Coptis chinensis]